MKNKIINALMFVAGAAAGSVVTWKLLDKKYEQLAQEEIDSVKEAYAKAYEESEEEYDDASAEEDYIDVIKESGYETSKEEGEIKMSIKPYIIKPNEFDELDDYETESWSYYADGVIVSEYGEVMDDADVDRLIGKDAPNHFGEYEPDSVFIRNDEEKTDFELLRDPRNFYDTEPA